MEVLLTLVHVGVLFGYACGLYFDVKPPKGSEYESAYLALGGRFKYLTFLDMLLQCGFFGICVINDLVGSNTPVANRRSLLQKIRDWLFTSLAFPLGVFVSFIFWALYAVDRELIFPSSLDAWFPCWLNHVMHTMPAIGAFIELGMVCHCYNRGVKLYMPIVTAYFLYLSWICYIRYAAGMWVYPVFDVLDMKSRTVFFAMLLLPNLLFVQLGQKIHHRVWGTGKQSKGKGKKEKSQ